MAKRFTDTELWKNQRWFRKLTPFYKLVFCYIKDQCNHAGVWRIDCSDLMEDLGIEYFDLRDFVESVNIEFDKFSGKRIYKERLEIVNETLLWITGFIQFQYQGKDGKVNWEVPAVKTALYYLSGLSKLEKGLNKGYISLKKPLEEGCLTPKDKDKDKERKGSMRGKQVEKPPQGVRIDSDRAIVFFEDGSCQALGFGQKKLLDIGELSPKDVFKGLID